MKTTLNFLFAIGQPITTINEARAFIRYLIKKGKCYHFDDDPRDIFNNDDQRVFTDHQADLLDERIDEIFSFSSKAWANYKCPFGYAMHYHKKRGDI
jgi:hypothetical protein